MWNRYRQTRDFKDDRPWLLHFFDQIRFYPVSESELLELRDDFITGKFKLRIEETTFSLKQYSRFLQQNSESIQAFKSKQQAAFEAERERWRATGQPEYASEIDENTLDESDAQSELDLPEGSIAIGSHITGTIWKILVEEGQRVTTGMPLIVIESMKMEFIVEADRDGTLQRIFCQKGAYVTNGQLLAIMSEA